MLKRGLSSLTLKELQQFVNSFDTVLCDVDGVLQYNQTGIPGAKDAVEYLRVLGKKIFFVTNNCVLTKKDFHEKLRNFGYNVTDGDIINPSIVIIDHLKKIQFEKKIFLFTVQGLKKELEEAGFEVVDAHEVKIEGKHVSVLVKIANDLDPDVGAVYLDNDVAFNYIALQQAVQYLKKPEMLLFGSGADKEIPVTEKIKFIGPKFFFDIFEALTGKAPMLMGKPEKHINEYILRKITTPSKTLFIGDSMEQDVKFAKTFGYQSLLVLTGVSTKTHLDSCSEEEIIPQYYVENLEILKNLLQKLDT